MSKTPMPSTVFGSLVALLSTKDPQKIKNITILVCIWASAGSPGPIVGHQN